jgi:hypothetical protein
MEKETLEEVKDINYWKNNCEENYITTPISVLRYISELERQQEKMYSEEEVLIILEEFKRYLSFGDEIAQAEWFKQFKKK